MAASSRRLVGCAVGAILGAWLTAPIGDARAQDCAPGFDPPALICTYPSYIDLVGARDGVADPYGAFTVTVRDAGGMPVVGCSVSVTLDCAYLTICAPDPTIAGQTPECATSYGNRVVAYTNANGVASFDIVGAAKNTGTAAGCGSGGAVIRTVSDTYVIGTATVTAFDQNGAAGGPGVNAADLGLWLRDFGQQATVGFRGRSDYNHDGNLSSADLARWLFVFGAQNSREGCAGRYCP